MAWIDELGWLERVVPSGVEVAKLESPIVGQHIANLIRCIVGQLTSGPNEDQVVACGLGPLGHYT